MIPPLQAAFFIKERPYKEVEEPEENKPKGCWGNFVAILSIWKNVFLTLRNRAYLVITIVFLLAWTTVQFVQNNLVLYCKYVLKQESQFEWFMLILQLTAALSLFGWSFLARKIGKQKVYWIGISIWMAVQIPMSFYNTGTPFWVMYINSVVAGMGVSVGT
jgi:glycoside/pentoside/hexuronide:cation symporter, GPH family